jgi:hypothetical protein
MKVDAVLERSGGRKLSPLQRKVLEYVEEHKDEVFSYRDADLARDLSLKVSAVGFTLWSLHQRDLIAKAKVGGKVYFGSLGAVDQLERRASEPPQEDWFERANRIREEIFRKHGYIDVLELLDEVREGR